MNQNLSVLPIFTTSTLTPVKNARFSPEDAIHNYLNLLGLEL